VAHKTGDLSQPLALILGAEDSGISNSLIKLTDHQIKIPVLGKIASLNVATAAGILIFEVLRQRNQSR